MKKNDLRGKYYLPGNYKKTVKLSNITLRNPYYYKRRSGFWSKLDDSINGIVAKTKSFLNVLFEVFAMTVIIFGFLLLAWTIAFNHGIK